MGLLRSAAEPYGAAPVKAVRDDDRASRLRRGLRLEYATIAYNSLEGLIAVTSGLFAGSIALTGFGIDSAIEVASGMALLWRLHSDASPARRERAEWRSLRIVGLCFIALTMYVAVDAISSLACSEAPRESLPGIVLAAASLIIMPLLARAKRRVAAAIGSAALSADAMQTQLCAWLSAILLGGLLLNAAFRWWWADPVAALIMVPIIAREGVQALRGRTCCCAHRG
ncbi:MAG TPA: cation transporter [Bryobacteraceae bacterium]|jgi:divalent metal cation (Fe/Co/Zn/Cd) transporter|nr:cation transporter [Bryobacteraceae bacterium]